MSDKGGDCVGKEDDQEKKQENAYYKKFSF